MVLSMDRWKGKIAIVTGASAGIGAAISEQLVSAGVIVVGFARRKELIEDLAKKLIGKKGKLHAVKVDLTKEQEILAGFKWVKNNLGQVHILINNAGIGKFTSLMDGDTKMWKDTFDTNVLGLCIATREACRVMSANNIAGHIIHINSVVGHFIYNTPFVNVYPATKHAITALTQQLRYEFNTSKLKIKISSISPGSTATGMLLSSGAPLELLEGMKGMPELTVDDVTDAVIYVLSTGPDCLVQDIILRPILDMY